MRAKIVRNAVVSPVFNGYAYEWPVGAYSSNLNGSIVIVYYASGGRGEKRALYMPSSRDGFYQSTGLLADGYVPLDPGTRIEITV